MRAGISERERETERVAVSFFGDVNRSCLTAVLSAGNNNGVVPVTSERVYSYRKQQ